MAAKLAAALLRRRHSPAAVGALAPGRLGLAARRRRAGRRLPRPRTAGWRRARRRARPARAPRAAGAARPAARDRRGRLLAARGARGGRPRAPAGPLAAEWRAVGREMALGVPLAEALARHGASGCRCPRSRRSSRALERARRHGAPLAETLAAQAATPASPGAADPGGGREGRPQDPARGRAAAGALGPADGGGGARRGAARWRRRRRLRCWVLRSARHDQVERAVREVAGAVARDHAYAVDVARSGGHRDLAGAGPQADSSPSGANVRRSRARRRRRSPRTGRAGLAGA